MSKRKLSDIGAPARVVLAEQALPRNKKQYIDLPEVLTQQKPSKKYSEHWLGFGSQLHPVMLVDEAGALVHSSLKITETITWTSITGAMQERTFESRPEKDGIYWFKRTEAYVLGSFMLSFQCEGAADCQPLTRYIPIVPGENTAADTEPPTDAVALLPRGSRLEWEWMGDRAMLQFGSEGSLSLSRYLWSSLREDAAGAAAASFRVPPFRPTVSDILCTTAQKKASVFSRHKEAGTLFCESMRTLFDSIFESTVLFPAERDYYYSTDIFSQLKKADARACDMFGGLHLLRFIVSISVALRHACRRSPGGAGRERRSGSSGRPADMASSKAAEYLTQEDTIQGMREILTELDNIYPLAAIS